MANVKILTGSKAAIDGKMTDGVIDEGDIIFTSDTDELVFINESKEKKIIKSKTQKEYTLNGTNLGALEDGSTIPVETSIDDLLAMITQKAIPATYEKPIVTLSRTAGSPAGSFEAGTSISVTLKSVFTQNDAGSITSHSIFKGSEDVYEGDLSDTITCLVDYFTIGDETVTFKSVAGFSDGAIKNNNLNQPSPEGQILAGSKDSSSVMSYVGQRNLFYGTGVGELPELTSTNIRSLSGTKLNPTQGYSWNIPVAIGQQYIIFAYPSSLRDVNQVMYVETNDTGMAPNFTKTLVQVEGANGYTAKEYKVYTYRMAVPAAATMTFKVTI